jgi:hypothetical protein
MDKIYLKDNYIVTELGGIIAVFPKNYSGYSENVSGFYINSTLPVNNQRTVFIDFADVGSIYDEAGVTAYTTDTLRTFLLGSTGFKSPSGGSGGVWGSITGTLSTQTDLQSALDAKQDDLISGTNIKTINSTSLLGSGDITVQPTLVSATNIKTVNGNSLLGSGDLVIGGGGLTVGTTAIASGTIGRILFQNGGDVLGQDSALFWDNTNKRLGIGATPSTSVRLDVRAQGALSTDIAFRVRNSADTYNIISSYGDELTIIGRNESTEPRLLINRAGSTKMVLGGTTDLNIQFPSSGFGQLNSGTQGWDIISSSGDIRTRNSSTFTLLKGNFFGIGQTTPSARLDVRAQGALSTDIAFRVRNSADSANILEQRGDSNLILTGVAPKMTYASANNGGSISHHPRGDSVINLKHSFTFFQSGFSDGSQSTAPKLNMICADITNYGMNNGFHWYFNNNLNPLDSERALWLTPKKTLSIFTGTGPDAYTAKVDSFELYSADIVAGNAAPHFRTENGNIIKLFRGSALTASDGTLANAVTRIAEIQARLQAHGLIA